jgi:hypothetical protein
LASPSFLFVPNPPVIRWNVSPTAIICQKGDPDGGHARAATFFPDIVAPFLLLFNNSLLLLAIVFLFFKRHF